ncbi:hypothetical protein BHE74_00024163 [Ensete ventricosum]|uniref:Uncharacterized protein n=1 Tax=Ensete ventricosum TaxID=4639 RepID=A0A444FFW8_ENSVE|nr:hypothetical protein B296_00039923 [Ensete ventricosum]RWW21502.1 hypothetical protein GW17_00014347 [Ensete ventricosum]RWW68325.1 hypothetical protein BHE74_00024163 [Ensete ventricosum]
MGDNGGSFVTVRRITKGPERGGGYHSTHGMMKIAPFPFPFMLTKWLPKIFVFSLKGKADENYIHYTCMQEECLHKLQCRVDVAYESSRKEHQETLRSLWYAAYPGVKLHGLISEQWKEMGWQGKDPSTDFRY